MKEFLKKQALSPFFAPIVLTLTMTVVLILGRTLLRPYIVFHDWGVFPIEQISDALWVVLFGVLIFYRHLFNKEKGQWDFTASFFLTVILFFRELGAHHWLASRDSTAFKTRFFTNPDNPLHEKIISGLIILAILVAVVWLLSRFLIVLVKGFFQLNTVCWTMAVFGTWGIICKGADRIPSLYYRKTQVDLSQSAIDFFSLVEESGEMFLPLLIILALWQADEIRKKKIA